MSNYTGPPSTLENIGSAIGTTVGEIPVKVKHLVAMLKALPTATKANPDDPSDPTGVGGAQREKAIMDAAY